MTLPVEFRHLRYFHFLAEELHFSRAARRANTTQPGLSQQIRRLEEVMGVRLFDRDRRNVRLTRAGEIFLEATRDIIDQVDQAVQTARQADHGGARRLQVGYSGAALKTPMGQILQYFRKHHPEIEVVIQDLWGYALERGLLDRTLHVAFLVLPVADSRIGHLRIGSDTILVCLPTDHRLAGHGAISIAELRGEPLIFFPEGHAPNVHRTFLSACRDAGFEPRVERHEIEPPKVIALVAAGAGIGFITTAQAGAIPPGVTLRPLSGDLAELPIALAWRIDTPDAAVASFVEMGRETIGQRPIET